MMPSENTIRIAIELSVSSWLVAAQLPGGEKSRLYRIEGGDTATLLARIDELRSQAARKSRQTVEVACCFEAGRDGFWLHRWLTAHGVLAHVLEPTSILVNRRARRAKTDRLDAAAGRRDFPELPASVTAMPAMFPWAFSDCAQWNVPPAPSQVAMPVTSDVPVLLTSGAFDATLPPSYAAEAAKTLKNSTNLVFLGVGHSASRWSPICFATVMANFLDQPNGFDYSCVAALMVSKFDTP